MADSNAVRFLAKSGVDAELALEQMFQDMVMVSFRAHTILWNSVNIGAGVSVPGINQGRPDPNVVASRSITEGFSHQFLHFGEDTDPVEHTPGTELLGQNYVLDEGNITVDDILVSHREVPLDQKMLSHFDIMQQVAASVGRSLAVYFDKKMIIVGLNAAYTAALNKDGLSVYPAGNVVERVDAQGAYGSTGAYPPTATGADNFRSDVAELASLMDIDNVPEGPMNRFLLITPQARRVLSFITNSAIFDRDLSRVPNSLNERAIGILEGFTVVMTNHIPNSSVTTGPSKYQIEAAFDGSGEGEPVALALCGAGEGNAAIGYVHAGGVQTHIEDDHRRNTTFVKAQILHGAGILSPYCAGVIHVDAS